MARRFSKSNLKKTETRDSLKKKRKTTSIGGQNINIETEPDTFQVLSGLQSGKTATNNSISLNTKARILLGKLDCEICSEEKRYSLITTCDDTEAIDNENIVDPSSYDVRPAPISATDKFTSDSDPFYNLDNDIPDSYSERNKKAASLYEPDFMCFVAKLYANGNNKNSNGNNEATGSMATATVETTTTTTTTY